MSKSKRRTESDVSHYKKRALFFSILAITLFFSVYTIAPVNVGASDQDTIQVGSMTATLTLETLALDDQGNYIESVSPNSPLYIGEVAVEQIRAFIILDAVGDFVDWSTLDVSLNLEVNGLNVKAWNLEGSSDSSSFSDSVEHDIDELDFFLQQSEGGELYIRALADITFNDHAGNRLESQDISLNSWTFTGYEEGEGGGDPEVMVEPQFTSVPYDATIEQGDKLDLTWVASDDNPHYFHIRSYSIYDGSIYQGLGSWSQSGAALTWDVGEYVSAAPGDYELLVTCRVDDEDGNSAYDTTNIQVHVVAAPDAPTFLKAVIDGDLIIFKPQSAIPSTYRVYHNGDLISSGTWTGGDIPIIIETMYDGENRIKCTVFDTEGRDASYTEVIVIGGDGVEPRDEPDPESPPINSPFSTGIGISMVMALVVITAVAGYYTIKWMIEK